MKYNQPFDQPSNPNAPYIDGNPAAGIQGSIVPAASIEYPQRELVNLTLDTGLWAPDNNDLHQLAKGIQAGKVNYCIDQGVPNAMAAVLNPVLVAYHDGLRVLIRAAYKNTGRTTLAIGALGTREVVRRDLTFLKNGDILPGAIMEVCFDAIHNVWQLMNVALGGGIPWLTANLTLYVNGNPGMGNDANDGTAADPAHALATIQRAIDIAFGYPPSQYTITVVIADCMTYWGFYTPYWSGPNILIYGNPANPAAIVVTGNNTHACWVTGVNTMTINGITASTTSGAAGPGGGFIASNSATLYTLNTRNLYVTGAVFEASAATMSIGKHGFSGNCGEMYWAGWAGNMGINDGAVHHTIEIPITVGFAGCYASNGGQFSLPPTKPIYDNPGNVTGQRYLADGNGVIFINGAPAGVNFFPGTVAGATAHGGQYY